ncbi:MAG: MTH1187 family thiamine-binding protein [Chrysiogenales bacterium]|nr:MAG: MTH1187 family thiamine-binding protein [Chrysiogenales bacterium]
MSAIADLAIFPLDRGESVSSYVAEAVSIIKSSGLDHEIGPMGTCFEGEWDEVVGVAKECMDAMNNECSRVYMVLKVDYRKGMDNRMKGKLESIKKLVAVE